MAKYLVAYPAMAILRKRLVVVALLTSIFWFVLNTLILYSYQGGFIGNGDSRDIGELQKNLPNLRASRTQAVDKTRVDESHVANENDNRDIDQDVENEKVSEHKDEEWFRQVLSHERNKLRKEQKRKNDNDKLAKEKFITHDTERTDQNDYRGDVNERGNNLLEERTTEEFERRNPNGPGENGQGVEIGGSEKEQEKLGYSKHAFNQLASDKISLFRSIPDTRDSG